MYQPVQVDGVYYIVQHIANEKLFKMKENMFAIQILVCGFAHLHVYDLIHYYSVLCCMYVYTYWIVFGLRKLKCQSLSKRESSPFRRVFHVFLVQDILGLDILSIR